MRTGRVPDVNEFIPSGYVGPIENSRLARVERGGILGGCSVYICSGIDGTHPSTSDMRLIIQSAGGTLLMSTSNADEQANAIIIVTSDTVTRRQKRDIDELDGKVAKTVVLSMSSFLDVILTQELPVEQGELVLLLT